MFICEKLIIIVVLCKLQSNASLKKKVFYWIHKIPSESFISYSCLPQASEQYFKKQSYFTHSCLPWASEQYLKKHSCFTQYALLWIFTFFYDFFKLFSTSFPIPRPILSNDVKIIFSNFSSFFFDFFSNFFRTNPLKPCHISNERPRFAALNNFCNFNKKCHIWS